MSDIASGIDESFHPGALHGLSEIEVAEPYAYDRPRNGHWRLDSSNGSCVDDGDAFNSGHVSPAVEKDFATASREDSAGGALAQRLMRSRLKEKVVAQTVAKGASDAAMVRDPVRDEAVAGKTQRRPRHIVVPILSSARREILEREKHARQQQEGTAGVEKDVVHAVPKSQPAQSSSDASGGVHRPTSVHVSGKRTIRILGKKGEETFVQVPPPVGPSKQHSGAAVGKRHEPEQRSEQGQRSEPADKPPKQPAHALPAGKQNNQQQSEHKAAASPPRQQTEYKLPAVESDRGSTVITNDEDGLAEVLISGALLSPSQRSKASTKQSEHGSGGSRNSSLSNAVLSIAQKIASMPPSAASRSPSVLHPTEAFQEVGQGVTSGVRITRKGSKAGSDQAVRGGFEEVGIGTYVKSNSEAPSAQVSNVGFVEEEAGRTFATDTWNKSTHEDVHKQPNEKFKTPSVALSGVRGSDTGRAASGSISSQRVLAVAKAIAQHKSPSQHSTRSAQTVASQGSHTRKSLPHGIARGRSGLSKGFTSQDWPKPNTIAGPGWGDPATPRPIERQSSAANSARGSNGAAGWELNHHASDLAKALRAVSGAVTSTSSSSTRPSQRPHLSGQSTPFAGRGWISPHPLSVASTEVGSPPQRAVKIPGRDTEITYEEWKAQRDSKDDIVSHSGSYYEEASRAPSVAASRVMSPVYNAAPPAGYVGSYRVQMHREPASETARRVANEQMNAGNDHTAKGIFSTLSSNGSRLGTPNANTRSPLSSDNRSWSIAEKTTTSSRDFAHPVTREADWDKPTERPVSEKTYSVGFTPGELQSYQHQLEDTVSRLSAQLSDVERDRGGSQQTHSSSDRRTRSLAPSPQPSSHGRGAVRLQQPNGQAYLPREPTHLKIPWDTPEIKVTSPRSNSRPASQVSQHTVISRHTQTSRAASSGYQSPSERSVDSESQPSRTPSRGTYGTADWQQLENAEVGRGGFQSRLW